MGNIWVACNPKHLWGRGGNIKLIYASHGSQILVIARHLLTLTIVNIHCPTFSEGATYQRTTIKALWWQLRNGRIPLKNPCSSCVEHLVISWHEEFSLFLGAPSSSTESITIPFERSYTWKGEIALSIQSRVSFGDQRGGRCN